MMNAKVLLSLALATATLGGDFGTEAKPFNKIIPTNKEMPTPDKYLNAKKPKNSKKKKRGY